MEVGAQVWLKDGDEWLLATITQKTEDSICISANDSKHTSTISINVDMDECDSVKLCNDEMNRKLDNSINLPHLHEPALLHCLKERYEDGDIYTYTGPILIAVNPFKRMNIYGLEQLSSYYNSGLLKSQGIETATSLPPHVFAIADAAYHSMMSAIAIDTDLAQVTQTVPQTGNQSILISGESGAGKTESTKIVLKYLTTVASGTSGLAISSGSVMDKILQSNPILEAFGNAATLRNDNSSRFGKFIQLSFNKRGHLIGGSIETYLLEKVRLPFQQLGQRNFHIFYQIAAGAAMEDKKRWPFPDIADIKYANQGQTFTLRNVDDAKDYSQLLKALDTLCFSPEAQRDLLQVMAAIVHLGQIEFVPDADGEGSEVVETGACAYSADTAARLLGVDKLLLMKCVTMRSILAMNEVIEKRLKASQASDARDALARHLYSKVFTWVVESVNASIHAGDARNCRAKIGVLDIFGFECFNTNSFEQLCINYTNEALQQQFNHFMFKTEQAEYEREKIDALLIEFSDNQDCLDLIDKKPMGVIAVLDDECRLPKGSDKNFSARLYKLHCSKTSRFSATATQIRNGEFVINHFAGGVCYNTAQFVDKNRDELPKECASLFATSTVELLSRVFVTARPVTKAQRNNSLLMIGGAGGTAATQRVTVGSQFREQLAGLLTTIHSTSPHYIRCLKPNDQNQPDCFNLVRCNEQLRYGGVLEAVRVARLGFPVRLSHAEFYSRYQPLANPFSTVFSSLPRMIDESEESPQEMCVLLLRAILDTTFPEYGQDLSLRSSPLDCKAMAAAGKIPSREAARLGAYLSWHGGRPILTESVQLGLTKVFFRKHAHDILEGRRSRRLMQASVKAQSCVRGYLKWSMFLDMKKAALLIQRVGRGTLSRVKTHLYRINKAATKIQAAFRSHTAYFEYNRFVMAVVVLQSCLRARLSRKNTFNYWFADRIERLQQVMLKLMYRRRFLRYRWSIVTLQAACRRRKTRGLLKAMRLEARDLGNLQQRNDMLKAEIKLMRKQASAESTRAEAIRFAQHEIEASKAKDVEIEQLNTEIVFLRAELQEEQNARAHVEAQLSKALKTAAAERRQFSRDLEELRQHLTGADAAAMEQLKLDLEMVQEDLSRESAMRRTLEKEVERLSAATKGPTGGGSMSPLFRGSPRSTGKSAIPRYVGGAMSPIARTPPPSRTVDTPQVKATPTATVKSTPSSSTQKDKQLEQQHREKELTSSTHFMRKDNKLQKRKQDLFRAKLKQGLQLLIYDVNLNVWKKALLRMDSGSDELYLCNRQARYSSIPTKMSDVKPVNFVDILECVPGALIDKSSLRRLSQVDVDSILSNQCFLTIVSHNANSGTRNLILLMETREERNSLLQNIRALAEEVQSKLPFESPVPAPPSAPKMSLPVTESKGNFASPTTASRRKSLSINSLPPDVLLEFAELDTPRTAQKRHDLFEKASARKAAKSAARIGLLPSAKPTAFIRNEDDATIWNPELRSYEQPTRSFLKSAEVASQKLNNVSDRNVVSVWRPGGVSSPYLSHKSLSARPLLSQFDEAGGDAPSQGGRRPPVIDTCTPDKEGSPNMSHTQLRRYSMSSTGSESTGNKSPSVKTGTGVTGSATKKSFKTPPKLTCSDSDDSLSLQTPRPAMAASPVVTNVSSTEGIGSPTATPKKRPNLSVMVEKTLNVANEEPDEKDVLGGLPPRAPNAPTPSRSSRTPDGSDATKKFSFKNFLLDEASAALSSTLTGTSQQIKYSAATANQVSPGGRIKEKFTNPSPSLMKFLSMSNSAKLVEVPKVPPSPDHTGGTPKSKGSKFSFEGFDLPITNASSAGDRVPELGRFRTARLQHTSIDNIASSDTIGYLGRSGSDHEKSAAERLKERLRQSDAEVNFEVGKRLEQALIDKKELSAELHTVKNAKSEEYEEFY